MARRSEQTILGTVVLGFFRGVWWLLKLPFRGLRRTAKLSVADHQYLITKRSEIEQLLQSDNLLELRHAVLEADKLADWILKKKNYPGNTFADRLRAAQKDIPSSVYNNIWQGHKIRNQIAHEDGNISAELLKSAGKNIMSYNN